MNASIVILNWNGIEYLEKCIPSVLKAAKAYNGECEIILVDNASSDGSVKFVTDNFPAVRIIALAENIGFAAAMNIGIRQSRHSIVIGLNNDIIAEEDFIGPLVRHFIKNDDIFAVSAKMLLWDKKTLNFGRAIGSFNYGLFRRKLVDTAKPTNTLYACGGGFAANKEKFLALGGFDEDMIVYWEDADICYRAWKQGWKTLYEPQSTLFHKRHGTYAKKCGEEGIRKISGENYFLFIIKNIHDRRLFYQQFIFLPVLVFASAIMGKSHFAKGLFLSMRRWPLFFRKRSIEKRRALLTDREIFRISGQ